MAKEMPKTPFLDQLESGPWPSFVTGLKRLAQSEGKQYADRMKDLLGQLEYSYETRTGYWKGGVVGVRGYGGGVIPRFSEVADKFPLSSEFHTLRVMPAPGMHYDTATLRKMCDIWEEHGTGLIALHGQSGDIMFQGCNTEQVQQSFDALNDAGFDLGGAGPCLRTSLSCVGPARCEFACYDTVRVHKLLINDPLFMDYMHRPSLPYKWKFKMSGCPNDCTNSIHRSDCAIIGTWKDDIQVDQDAFKAFVAEKGRKDIIDNIIVRCPTEALSLNDDDSIDIDNKNCVRCMHCINVCPKALAPGKERGAAILIGGHHTLKMTDTMGTVIIPFMALNTDEDFQKLFDFCVEVFEFFMDNALEHERIGEVIDRIGLANFLDAIGVDAEPNMIIQPRTDPYFNAADWDAEVEKWNKRQAAAGDD
jgi:dissimilatory sulfite reductase alpha subunit